MSWGRWFSTSEFYFPHVSFWNLRMCEINFTCVILESHAESNYYRTRTMPHQCRSRLSNNCKHIREKNSTCGFLSTHAIFWLSHIVRFISFSRSTHICNLFSTCALYIPHAGFHMWNNFFWNMRLIFGDWLYTCGENISHAFFLEHMWFMISHAELFEHMWFLNTTPSLLVT